AAGAPGRPRGGGRGGRTRCGSHRRRRRLRAAARPLRARAAARLRARALAHARVADPLSAARGGRDHASRLGLGAIACAPARALPPPLRRAYARLSAAIEGRLLRPAARWTRIPPGGGT